MTRGSGRNRRKHERKPVELPVIASDSENRVSGSIRLGAADLSTGGAFLCSNLLFELDEELVLEIQLGSEVMKVRGKVVRVARGQEADGPLAGMGIEFLDMSESDRARVLRFIEEAPE